MDAPPDKENSDLFVTAAENLSRLGVHTPQILAKDLKLGFLVLEDLGKTDYLSQLTSLNAANTLYADALEALFCIQQGNLDTVEAYTATKLNDEMSLFDQWYLNRHLSEKLSDEQISALEATKSILIEACLEQPQTWVHRDFHSRNLMVTSEHNPGVIDFQDLVSGPITYDLASLFKDCYIEWPRKQQIIWLRNYFQKLQTSEYSFDQFIRWYDLTAFQRHLKVLGIFCRLNYRDGKAGYLNDLPLVSKYCIDVLDRYPELSRFNQHFRASIQKSL